MTPPSTSPTAASFNSITPITASQCSPDIDDVDLPRRYHRKLMALEEMEFIEVQCSCRKSQVEFYLLARNFTFYLRYYCGIWLPCCPRCLL